jgi:hypothetical protein
MRVGSLKRLLWDRWQQRCTGCVEKEEFVKAALALMQTDQGQ